MKKRGKVKSRLFFPGTKVMVYDPRLYKDDVTTPISMTVKEARVIRWYGMRSEKFGLYPELIDVEFMHRPGETSVGHFTTNVEVIPNA